MKRLNRKGVTLIELLVGLVIGGMVSGGIYQVFIAQSKAYTVQDQVVEVQQSVRSAMEILLRDLRMAGYDSDNLLSTVTITSAVANLSDSDMTVNYEYYDKIPAQYQKHTVRYWRDGGSSRLFRQLTVNDVATAQEALLGCGRDIPAAQRALERKRPHPDSAAGAQLCDAARIRPKIREPRPRQNTVGDPWQSAHQDFR